eukprot:4228175-Pyramimonas_sp.AAC.1
MTDLLKLLKSAYGPKGAPRLWKLRLDQYLLTSVGGQQSSLDGCIWMWFKDGKLHRLPSTRIDGLKGAGFEHCGIQHKQLDDGSITITQDHYIKELKPIPLTAEQRSSPGDVVGDALHGHFLALEGGLEWAVNTRHDIAVYVGALQRHQRAPTIMDVINLNRVLRWAKRKHCVIRFEKMLPPLRILVISDSAFKREN